MRSRHGFTLTEVLVALTLVTVMATLTADLLLRATLRVREARRRVEQVDDARHLASALLAGPCAAPTPAIPTRHASRVETRDSAQVQLVRIAFDGPASARPVLLERACD